MKRKNIVLFGPPGVGKGAQATRLSEHLEIVHVSTGVLLRVEIANRSALGLEIKDRIERGEFAEDPVVMNLVDRQLGGWRQKPRSSSGGRPVRTFELVDVLAATGDGD